ncbi:MAG TPA: phage terminase large subunit [Candidatus Megaira endosymbiont of Hartmannula sinica]|nr:phage terminase large subunit [Candidatus Megaera endosymbiont of Hartmannula sinica]
MLASYIKKSAINLYKMTSKDIIKKTPQKDILNNFLKREKIKSSQNKIFSQIIKKDLRSFIHTSFLTINPGQTFENNWHINLMAKYLEEVAKGNIKRLIINIPPRSLKSICCSVAFPAWVLGNNPTKRIILASYSNILSEKHSFDSRHIINQQWYKRAFPETIINKKYDKRNKFITTKNGFRFATSVLGSVTGEGGDILIIDDPHNPMHVSSNKMRNKAIEWFSTSFATRLNNPKDGAIIIVMQRLHSDDISSFLIKNKEWELLKIPAYTNKDIFYSMGGYKYKFCKNSYLHAKRNNKETIDNIKKNLGYNNFMAQYMQSPIDNRNGILRKANIHFYNVKDLLDENNSNSYFILSWDTAIKTSSSSDYSVCTIWKILLKSKTPSGERFHQYNTNKSKYYLVNLIRKKMSYPDLKNTQKKLLELYKPKITIIEDKASGSPLIQDLKNEGYSNIYPFKPKYDKITRFASIIPEIESGKVKFPSKSIFYDEMINEMTNFPYTEHDDIIDSISQFLHFQKNNEYKELNKSKPSIRII